jgi:hypothetical protein
MRSLSAGALLVTLVVGLMVVPASPLAARTAEEEELNYRVIQTEDLRLLYYDEDHAYVTPHLARCFENAFAFHERLFDYVPSEEVTIGLQDFDDHGYAGTTAIPHNFITLGIEPFEYVYDTCPTNERFNWVMNHELVHVVACDQASSSDRFFRRLFLGKVVPTDEDPVSVLYSYMTAPRYYAPRWYHEGIATFLETWMAGGIGRAQTGYDEMAFRTMVRDDDYFYSVVGLESEGTAVDFQIGQNSYLYGTRFVNYLAYRYGPEKVIDWFKRGDGSSRYFSHQFRRVFGTSLHDEWSKWIDWEHGWQQANLDSIRRFPITPHRVLSDRPLGSVSREFYDEEEGKLYAAVRYPGEFAYIASIDVATGDVKLLCEIPTPAMYYVSWLAYDPGTRTIFYTTDNGSRWRDLCAYDLKTGKSRLLSKDCRTGDLAFNEADGSLWGIQHHEGRSRLVRFPPPYDRWQEILVFTFGKDVFDIDISPDGTQLTASLVEVNGRQRLISMDTEGLLSWNPSYDVLYEFPDNAPANFVHSADGLHLYGTSYYTGVSNIFRYDFETGEMKAVSNCETGLFRPIPAGHDSLVSFMYTADGFVPVMLRDSTLEDVSAVKYLGAAVADKRPVVRDWLLGSPREVNLDSLTIYAGDYQGLRNIRPASAYPIVEGYKDHAALGVRLNLSDPAWLHNIKLTASYTPDSDVPEDERFHATARYRHGSWTLEAASNRADFYDLFGPTKSSRKGYSVSASFSRRLYDETPRSLNLSASVAHYGGLVRLPYAQNIATSYDRFQTAGLQLTYADMNATIGAVEAERGLMATLAANDTYVLEHHKVKLRADITRGFLTPMDHSSVWLLTSFGYSFGELYDSFSNFYFGGFGNNWVDAGSINRYRRYYSFPGVELNDIGGRTYAKGTIEWALPPVRFRKLGFPALYANWAHLSLFTSGIVANPNEEGWERRVADAGAQLNAKVVIFSSLSSTFSVGYAASFEEGRAPERETMVSLNILN